MGTKFGNIHVKTNDPGELIAALEEVASARIGNSYAACNVTGFEQLLQQIDRLKNVFYVGEWGNGWVSVLNDGFGWGEVESFGEVLSSEISSPVLTISYFDDDVLEMNVYSNGELITGHLWCSIYAQADYDLEQKVGDISVLSQLLGHEHVEKLLTLLDTVDREKAVEQLESIMGVPLWIHSDWFGDIHDDASVKQYVKHDFNK